MNPEPPQANHQVDGFCQGFISHSLRSHQRHRAAFEPHALKPMGLPPGWGKIWFKHHLYKGRISITRGLNMFKPMGGPTLAAALGRNRH